MLEDFIRQLAQEMEIGDSFPTTASGYALALDENLTMNVTPLTDSFLLSATLAPCPTTNKEGFYSHLLHGNLFGQATRDAVLGLNDEGNQLTLSRIVDYNIDYKRFREAIEDFINICDFWREETLLYK